MARTNHNTNKDNQKSLKLTFSADKMSKTTTTTSSVQLPISCQDRRTSRKMINQRSFSKIANRLLLQTTIGLLISQLLR